MNSKTAVIALCAAMTSGAAFAQGLSFSEIDGNANGVLELAELESVFGPQAAATLSQLDADRDGLVTAREAQAGSAGNVSDNEALPFEQVDLDRDGVLDEDELEHSFGPEATAALLGKFSKDGETVTLDDVRASDDSLEERRNRGSELGQADRGNRTERGDRGAAASGDRGAAASGDRGAAASGDRGAAASGDRGSAASGDRGAGASR